MLYVFTTCALNFVPCAKLLAASVREHMPDARFALVLTDERPATVRLEDEGFDEVFYLEDFADDLGNPRGWAFGHTIMELATAIKPFAACKLMDRDNCDTVMFFDPDCVLFGPMTEMREVLETHSVALTPHASLLHENEDWIFFEKNPLKVGGFNLGFFGFRNNKTGRSVASWWRYRLRDYCLIDQEQGLFTDQKWMDLLPSYIDDLKVMRAPVYNVARWNTFQRTLSKKGQTYLVDGEPAQFIHFSGFYKIGPYVQGLYDRSSEPLIQNIEILQELSIWYSGQLETARTHPDYVAAWGFDTYKNGEPICPQDRRRYKASPDLQARYPDPFDTQALDSYWLNCRKLDRIESETQFKEHEPMAELATRGVQAHNTILRQRVQALEKQVRQMTTEAAQNETRTHRHDFLVAQFMKVLHPYLATASEERINEFFAPLVENGAFVPEAYLQANPDVAEAGMDPLAHFVRHGLSEGRSAGTASAQTFLEANLARLASFISLGDDDFSAPAPVTRMRRQYLATEIRDTILPQLPEISEERINEVFAPLVDNGAFAPEAYLQANPDVAEAGMDPLVHFIRHGLREGRSAGDMSGAEFFRSALEKFLEVVAPAAAGTRRPLDSLDDVSEGFMRWYLKSRGWLPEEAPESEQS